MKKIIQENNKKLLEKIMADNSKIEANSFTDPREEVFQKPYKR